MAEQRQFLWLDSQLRDQFAGMTSHLSGLEQVQTSILGDLADLALERADPVAGLRGFFGGQRSLIDTLEWPSPADWVQLKSVVTPSISPELLESARRVTAEMVMSPGLAQAARGTLAELAQVRMPEVLLPRGWLDDQPVLETLAGLTRLWDSGARPQLRRALEMPPNWVELADIDTMGAQEALLTGVPLAVVPRPSTVRAALAKTGPGSQRGVLWSRRRSVLADCRSVLDQLDLDQDLTPLLLEAIEVAEGGKWRAAQSLAANVVDAALSRRGEGLVHDDVKTMLQQASKRARPTEVDLVGDWVARMRWVGLMLIPAYSFVPKGIRPAGFNRHATAHHALQTGVYSAVNGLCAVVVATAGLWLLDQLGRESPK